MQNIHAHVTDSALHLTPDLIREADLSRGFKVDLTVRCEALIQDSLPFDRVAVFGMKARLAGWWVPDAYTAEILKELPEKFVGFATFDPTVEDDPEDWRHSFEELGLKGLKLGPMYAGFDPRDPRCDAIYACCEAQGLPVLFHVGTTFVRKAPLEFSRPWLWDEVANRYPELRIVMAHVGHPWCDECLVVIRKHPHVYADISALYYRPWQFYQMLVAAQEYGVTHKLIFGTDYPFAKSEPSIDGLRNANAVAGSAGLPEISQETIDGILNRDAFSLLGIS